jgi:hypothetical protein
MAYDFNGTDQHLYATAAVVSAAPLAMSCWFKPDNTTTWGELVAISKDTGSGVLNFFRMACFGNHASADPLVAQAANDSGLSGASTTTDFVAGVWQHAFAVFASSTSRTVWLNGGGSGTNSTSRIPSGLNRTAIGTKICEAAPGYSGSFDGQIAEAAIWAGSGVENMGATEAAILAAGFSPRCLRRWLSKLVLFQDLIRPLNRPGDGFPLTANNSPGVAPHPRVICPAHGWSGLIPPHAFVDPFRAATGASDGSRIVLGGAAVAGTVGGETFPLGEVSG